ncbi:FAD/NAD(P)-binding protein [Acinetobacter seifertii]|uniref:FAD/NAD(P)-binding protein n=1 Tax=Acinetobacter seifertii TaxID=1530123 RepID=UPI0018DB6245|nr:FAD/NAD(P)-binding protein [Acinetobacter seifertii]QPV58643.1 FAD/NAD(P)-binding protein [Acinetobacter seifertii]
MDDITLKKFCIIGMGFSGTCTFISFVKKLLNHEIDHKSCSITLVEMRESLGHGNPYDKDELLAGHLCNNPAHSMSLWDNDFVDWMVENKNHLMTHYPHLVYKKSLAGEPQVFPDPNAFYPRALFGIYLNDRFKKYLELAKLNRIKVEVYNGYEAIDGYEAKGGYNLVIKNQNLNRTIELKGFSKLLLTIGHWTAIRLDSEQSLFVKPYPFQKVLMRLNDIIRQDHKPNVLVRGMGPSGVDTVITLFSEGSFVNENGTFSSYQKAVTDENFKAYVVSRSGYFPAVRGNKPNYDFKYFTHESFPELQQHLNQVLSLDDILHLLDLELKNATNGEVSFNDLCNLKFANAYEKLKYDLEHQELNDLINMIILKVRRMKFYRYLSSHDKKRYDQEFDHLFIRLAVPIPLENAQKLKCLFEADLLQSLKLGYNNKPLKIMDSHVQLIDDLGHSFDFDLVVNTISQDFDIYKHPSALVKSLLEQKNIVPNMEDEYNTGGLMLDGLETYKLMENRRGTIKPSEYFYSFGVLTRYWQNERNFSKAIVDAADSVSTDWVELFQKHLSEPIFTPEQLYKIS